MGSACKENSILRRKQEHSASHGVDYRNNNRRESQKRPPSHTKNRRKKTQNNNIGISSIRQNNRVSNGSRKICYRKGKTLNQSNPKTSIGKTKPLASKRVLMTPKQGAKRPNQINGRSRLKRIQRSIVNDSSKHSRDKLPSQVAKQLAGGMSPGSKLRKAKNGRNDSGSLGRRRRDQSWSYKAGSSRSSGRGGGTAEMQESLGSEYMLRRVAARERKISPESFRFSEKSSKQLGKLNKVGKEPVKGGRLVSKREDNINEHRDQHDAKQAPGRNSPGSEISEKTTETLAARQNLNSRLAKSKRTQNPGRLKNKQIWLESEAESKTRGKDMTQVSRIKRDILSSKGFKRGTPTGKRVAAPSHRDRQFPKTGLFQRGLKHSQMSKQFSQKTLHASQRDDQQRQNKPENRRGTDFKRGHRDRLHDSASRKATDAVPGRSFRKNNNRSRSKNLKSRPNRYV